MKGTGTEGKRLVYVVKIEHGPFREVMDHRHFLLRHDSRVHFRIPFAVPNGVEDVHLLALCLRVHAPFRLCVVGVLEDVLQRCVPCSQSDAIDVQVPRYTLRWDLPEYYDVEGCRIIEGENDRVGGGRDVRVDSREVARNVFPPAAVDKGG